MSSNSLHQSGLPEPLLYLHRSVLKSPVRYSLHLSYWNSSTDNFSTTELMDLGALPEKFLHYPNDTCFHLDPDMTYQIDKLCGRDMESRLEELLWPFVDPSVQFKMEHFFSRGKNSRRFKAGLKLLSCDNKPVHSFDKRRLHFLRFGATDQGRIFQMPPRLEAKLLNRSRDELEQYFLEEEARLREFELKSYLYASLNLQSHFTEPFARSIPQALAPDKIDEAFLKELCRLNEDRAFWQERTDYSSLPTYLIRYLILFFDSNFPRSNQSFKEAQDFQDTHRQFRWPKRKEKVSHSEISVIFEVSEETLQNADKKEITRLYRKTAKSIHPDTGGDHEEFVRLTEAYEELLLSKKK